MRRHFDFVVIGAGMAGTSMAAALAEHASVLLLEQEAHPGYHSTGRSAALFSELYGNPTIRSLTRASRRSFFEPAPDLVEHPLVSSRPTLYFASESEMDLLRAMHRESGSAATTLLSAAEVEEELPVFAHGHVAGALADANSADIDVNALLQGLLRQFRRREGVLVADAFVTALSRSDRGWTVSTAREQFSAGVIVNAAGAWGDEVARLAKVPGVGLSPLRRTAVLVELGADLSVASWPAAVHVCETYYFKPDAGLLLLSPADETPSAACDAQAEELDVAVAIDRFESGTGTPVAKVRAKWAGLRSFVADRTPVVGFDPSVPDFFWLVGQGGYGIQTAPALSLAACALARRVALPKALLDDGLTEESLSPSRASLRK